MKVKQNKFKIKIEPYEAILNVIISENVPETVKNINKEQHTEEEDSAVFIYEIPDNRKYIIVIPYNTTPGILAHEILHISLMLLNNCGVEIIKNDEPLAYCIGFLVDKIWNKLQKLNSTIERSVEKDDSNKNQQERLI